MVRPNIEFFEATCPIWSPHYEVLQDWEGAGEFRGGPGVYVEMAANDDMSPDALAILMTGNSDGFRFAPRGTAGGQAAPMNEMWIESPNGETRVLPTMANMPIHPGEVCKSRAGGGGGWGDPLDRDPGRVQTDVVDGLVSLDRARDVYGVVLEPGTHEVLLEQTEQRRDELRAATASTAEGGDGASRGDPAR